jgi:hypothetical protein
MKVREKPFNGAFKPLESFLAHSKGRAQPRKQYDSLNLTVEGVRKIAVLATRGEGKAAHVALDDLLRTLASGHTKLADMHLKDVGVPHEMCAEFEEVGIHTVKDIAGCTAASLATRFNLMDGLKVTLAILQRTLERESERESVRF